MKKIIALLIVLWLAAFCFGAVNNTEIEKLRSSVLFDWEPIELKKIKHTGVTDYWLLCRDVTGVANHEYRNFLFRIDINGKYKLEYSLPWEESFTDWNGPVYPGLPPGAWESGYFGSWKEIIMTHPGCIYEMWRMEINTLEIVFFRLGE
jgi:hypothetical protein